VLTQPSNHRMKQVSEKCLHGPSGWTWSVTKSSDFIADE
jgi:hypothetical protein